VAEFRSHLDFLSRHFHPVSMADVAAHHNGERKLPEGSALITFDDGYRNNLTHAAPLLRAAGIPCVFFVSTGYVGTKKVLWTDEVVGRIVAWTRPTLPLPGEKTEQELPHDPAARRQLAIHLKERCKGLDWHIVQSWLKKLRSLSSEVPANSELHDFMTWDEVRVLRAQGFEIGSHTVSHPILTRIPPGELDRELTESKQTIEREVATPCKAIAYPNGGSADVSETVFSAGRRAGYRLGFTVSERHSPPGEDAMSISRICIQGHLPVSSFSHRVDGVERLLRFGASRIRS
jgi:peptidoglycan/xylan/chitin deacetylase (PgdA/CDA1 family)